MFGEIRKWLPMPAGQLNGITSGNQVIVVFKNAGQFYELTTDELGLSNDATTDEIVREIKRQFGISIPANFVADRTKNVLSLRPATSNPPDYMHRTVEAIAEKFFI